MDEYYINYHSFKNIIDKIDKKVDDEILYLLQQIMDKFDNMEDNIDTINGLIARLEEMFIQYFYDYNIKSENFLFSL